MNKSFIVNRQNDNLKKRLDEYLPKTDALDILVGYFYAQGFHIIKENFKNTKKIRILVGMGTDKLVFIQNQEGQQKLDIFSDKQIAEAVSDKIIEDTSKATQTEQQFDSLYSIKELVGSGKLEIKAYRKQQLHAKMYLLHTKAAITGGAVITGSSNLTKSGLLSNLEINALLTDGNDFDDAKKLFLELWEDAVDISEILADKLENETWLKPVNPSDIFYRAAYEYIGGSEAILNPDDDDISSIRSNFIKLQYQEDAARQAVDVIRQFNGVFLSDVVGLGKTIMGSLVLRKLRNMGMRSTAIVICAPGLIKEWQSWTSDIGSGAIRVYSSGDLKKIRNDIKDGALKHHTVDTILIDESHNFRNPDSDTYSILQDITHKKRVILLSATPQTKSTMDLAAQLNLFADQTDFIDIMQGKSVKVFFSEVNELKTTEEKSKKLDALMRAVMIRRTRSEILKYYSEDIISQGLKFPKAADPKIELYNLVEGDDNLLDKIEELISSLDLPRFQPRAFIKDEYTGDKTLQDLSKGGEQLRAINRILMFKRLESSIKAAQSTLERQFAVNKKFIEHADKTGVLPFGIDNLEMIKSELDIVYDELDNATFVLKGANQNYLIKKFKYNELKLKIEKDNKILTELISLLSKIDAKDDSKLQRLVYQLTKEIKNEKVLIFTESKVTAEYLQKQLNLHLKEEVGIAYGQLNATDYENVKKRFSPKSNNGLPKGKSALRLVVATDTFSEGVNLQDANHVINYDIPWNPIRIIQRVGRINRVGSEHDTAYSYNYFPSDEIDSHIGSNSELAETLKKRVSRRIEEFQKIIGDDTKHLSPEESPEPKKLFEIVTKSADDLEGSISRFSFSELVSMLRQLRDKDPDYYDYITQVLPKKAWSSKMLKDHKDIVVAVAKRDKHIVFFNAPKDKDPTIIDPTTGFNLLYSKCNLKANVKRPPKYFGICLNACENAFVKQGQQDIQHRRLTPASYEGKLHQLVKDHNIPSLSKDITEKLNIYKQALEHEKILNKKAVKTAYNHVKACRNAAEIVESLNTNLPLEDYLIESDNITNIKKPEILLSCLMTNN